MMKVPLFPTKLTTNTILLISWLKKKREILNEIYSFLFKQTYNTMVCKTYIESPQQDESWPDAKVIDAAQGDGDSEGVKAIALE